MNPNAHAHAPPSATTTTSRSPANCSSHAQNMHNNRVLTLDTGKAGMGAVKKEDVERIINEVSAGTPFYINEERKRQQRQARNEEIVQKVLPLRPELEQRGLQVGSDRIQSGGDMMGPRKVLVKSEGQTVVVKKEQNYVDSSSASAASAAPNAALQRLMQGVGGGSARRRHTCGGGGGGAKSSSKQSLAFGAAPSAAPCLACADAIVAECDAFELETIKGLAGWSMVHLRGGGRHSVEAVRKLAGSADINVEQPTEQRVDGGIANSGGGGGGNVLPAAPTSPSAASAHAFVALPSLAVKVPNFFGVFAHLDMDAFFAAVAEKDDPSLRDIPFAVGGLSMLSTSSYKARQYGVRAAMPGYIAKRLCPELVIVNLEYSRYVEESTIVKKIIAEYDPQYSSGGLDEVGMDLLPFLVRRRQARGALHRLAASNNSDSIDSGEKMGAMATEEGKGEEEIFVDVLAELPQLLEEASEVIREIRGRIYAATQLTASAGIAYTKCLAKIMSNKKKPNGQYTEGFAGDGEEEKKNDADHNTAATQQQPLNQLSFPPIVSDTLIFKRHSQWLLNLASGNGGGSSGGMCVKREKHECGDEHSSSSPSSHEQQQSAPPAAAHDPIAIALIAHLSTSVVGPLRPREIPFVGKAQEELLSALGIAHCSDMYALRYALHHALTPKAFEHMLAVAMGCMGSWGGGFGVTVGGTTKDTAHASAAVVGEKRPRTNATNDENNDGEGDGAEDGGNGGADDNAGYYHNPFGRHHNANEMDRKSLSIDRTFPRCTNPSELVDVALRITNIVSNRILEENLSYKHVTLKLKGTDFHVHQYSESLPFYVVRAVGEAPERPKEAHRNEPCPMALPTPCSTAAAAAPSSNTYDPATRGGEETDNHHCVDGNGDEESYKGDREGGRRDDGIRATLWGAVSRLLGPHLVNFANFRLMGVRCGTLALSDDVTALNEAIRRGGNTAPTGGAGNSPSKRRVGAAHSSVANNGAPSVLSMMFAKKTAADAAASLAAKPGRGVNNNKGVPPNRGRMNATAANKMQTVCTLSDDDGGDDALDLCTSDVDDVSVIVEGPNHAQEAALESRRVVPAASETKAMPDTSKETLDTSARKSGTLADFFGAAGARTQQNGGEAALSGTSVVVAERKQMSSRARPTINAATVVDLEGVDCHDDPPPAAARAVDGDDAVYNIDDYVTGARNMRGHKKHHRAEANVVISASPVEVLELTQPPPQRTSATTRPNLACEKKVACVSDRVTVIACSQIEEEDSPLVPKKEEAKGNTTDRVSDVMELD